MSGKGRHSLAIGLILGTLLIASAGELFAFDKYLFEFLFQGDDASRIQINANISPETIQPGDSFQLSVELTNQNDMVTAPAISILIPNSVALELDNLPAGTSYNIKTREFAWQPLLSNAGDQSLLRLNLKAEVADLRHPEQSIGITVQVGDYRALLDARYWLGIPPVAQIVLGKTTVAVGESFELIADVNGPGPLSQRWLLGDGRSVDALNPEVIYPEAGTYLLSLQATNPAGTSIAEALVNVIPNPVARFSASDTTVMVGQAVQFINESGGQAPTDHTWHFGDGSQSKEPNPIHPYAQEGVYEVRLVVENEIGVSETSGTITVGAAPAVDFVISSNVAAGILFQASALVDTSVSAVRWDMGDGNTYDGFDIGHVYWSAGDYMVSMSAENDFGISTISQVVTVEPGRIYLYLPLVSSNQTSVSPPEPLESTAERIEEEPIHELQPLDLPPMSKAEELFAYINEARRINGLPTLNLVASLNTAAQGHVDDMASARFTGHDGSDGSSPAQRIFRAGYAGGYAGEATAWGMQTAIEPVRFWLESPGHRAILLDPAATDVGVGFTIDLSAPNVWYWTAEFASLNLPRIEFEETPAVEDEDVLAIDLLGPPRDTEITISPDNYLIFTWQSSRPLADGERYAVYFRGGGRVYQVGVIRENQPDNQYTYRVAADGVPVTLGQMQWQIRLENSNLSATLYESEFRPIVFRSPQADQ